MQKVISYLENSFNKKVRVDGDFVKLNLEEMGSAGIKVLNQLNTSRFDDKVKDLNVKRSGTGIVVIVETK